MATSVATILTLVWIAWATQAVLSAMLVRKFARGLERPPRQAYLEYRPRTAVIVPLKGLDLDLRTHVQRFLEQDHPDHRLIFVVESQDDPAHALVREVLTTSGGRGELIVAGKASDDQGQKVHNLLAAVAHLERAGGGEAVWAFADSDAAADPHWLASLVGPLGRAYNGVTTGYRWFVPQSPTPSVWSHFASVMNSSVACWAGRDEYNHAWGGSMAMRVETARRGDLAGYWRGALSDDYQVTRMCRDLGLRLYFVHRCLVASPVDFDFASLWRFARRQYIITRTHAPRLYWAAAAMQTLYVVGFVATCAAALWFAIARPGDVAVLLPLSAFVIVSAAERIRSRYRRRVIGLALGDAAAAQLRMTLWIDAHLTPLWMTLHWLIVLSAMFGRTITWRGNRYRIAGPQSIRKLAGR